MRSCSRGHSQLSVESDLVISEPEELASALFESPPCLFPDGASVEGEVASIVGRFTGLFGERLSSSLGEAALFRTCVCVCVCVSE